MAGAILWLGYTSDDGLIYSYKQDYSNGSALVLGGSTFVTGGIPPDNRLKFKLPLSIKPRYALTVLQSNPKIKRRFVVGSPEAWKQLHQQISPRIRASVYPIGSVQDDFSNLGNFVVTSLIGERNYDIPQILRTTGFN
jgi:hypothetical protein